MSFGKRQLQSHNYSERKNAKLKHFSGLPTFKVEIFHKISDFRNTF